MTDRHCRIGRIATRHQVRIPGFSFLERIECIEDYDAPPNEQATDDVWYVYRHHNSEVGRYA